MRLQEMPPADRPREKAERIGIGSLSDAELLAIFIRTGMPGKNAIQLSTEMLEVFGGIKQLSRFEPREIRARFKGLGPAKSIELAAAFEIGRRLARGQSPMPVLDTPERVMEVFGQEFMALHQESLRVLLLDTKLRLVRMIEISRGTVNECTAHPREILRHALTHSAYAIVLVHNHPSGDPSPSAADIRVTRSLAEAANLLQINLIDHVILGSPDGGRSPFYSFREGGIL